MSIIGQNILAGASGGGAYTIDQSLRFEDGDSPYLNRDPSSAGNRRTFTLSMWFKRGNLSGSSYRLFNAYESDNDRVELYFDTTNDNLSFEIVDGGVATTLKTSQLFRDPSAWYHLVYAVDTTQGTDTDRVNIYINGSQITAFDTTQYPAENADTAVNYTVEQVIGRTEYGGGGNYYDGYMAEVYLTDGTQYAASDFGETNSTTNQWIPKDASGLTFGTNGFYQKYAGDMGGYTQLLLHCDGASSGTTFTDSSQSGRAVTADNVTTNTTTKKFGTASAYFPGSGDNSLSIPDNAVWDIDFGSSWTWEFWMNAVVPPEDYAGIITHHNAGAHTPGWGIVFNDASYIILINLTTHASWAVKSSSAIPNGAWHHYAFVHDNDADTMKLYIDGALDATGSTSAITLPTSTGPLIFGHHHEADGRQFEGYLDEIRFSTTARYKAAFTVQTEAFGDTSLGADSSGNNNTFTVNNIGITDQVPDSPTNNFCTWNPLDNDGANQVLTEGNLKAATHSYQGNGATFELPLTGKWYAECRAGVLTSGSGLFVGIADPALMYNVTKMYDSPTPCSVYRMDGLQLYTGGNSRTTDIATWVEGDILGFAVDMDTDEMWLAKNGVWQGSSSPNPSTGTAGFDLETAAGVRYTWCYGSGSTNSELCFANFGQDSSFAGLETAQGNADGNGIGDFYYTVPTGFLTCCTSNLDAPSIKLSGEHYNTLLWTGDGGVETVAGAGFEPSLVWCTGRSNVKSKKVYDQIRGISYALRSNTTAAESYSTTENLTSFDSDGFTIKDPDYISNGQTFASWLWKGAGAGSANTDGSINSTVSANVAAGFSIVTYTGNNTSPSTIGHGLSQAPEMVITKRRDSTGTWFVGHQNLSAWTYFIDLNEASGQTSNAQVYTTAPTASVFSIGNEAAINANTGTFVSYCFHSIEGYSRLAYYNGSGDTDGSFCYTGFRPAVVFIKMRASAADWHTFDSARIGYNVANYDTCVAENTAELTTAKIDFVSNGFKLRISDANINGSGQLYIIYAVAESPFKYALAR